MKTPPLISLPLKGARDADWTGCIRSAISEFYGADPDDYAQECAKLEQCRKRAVETSEKATTGGLHSWKNSCWSKLA